MDDSLQAQDDAAAKVAVAPRVTLEDIEARIASENYINAGEAIAALGQPVPINLEHLAKPDVPFGPAHLLTICVLVLKNGFTVTGESACASPENFNRELGQQIARRNALEKVWMLEGYLLRERLSSGNRAAT